MIAEKTILKPGDIRVGNWVNHEYTGPFQWDWKHFADYVKDERDGFEIKHLGADSVISDKIEPIPLTPEILEKAGWGKRDVAGMEEEHKCYFFQNGDIEFGWDNYSKEVDMFYDDATASLPIRHIKHLHELQNFIYALTGEELNIEL